MKSISNSVKKKDHESKITGKSLYVDDLQIEGLLCGKIYRSSKAKARIINISIPQLKEGYYIVDKNDVPGVNRVIIVKDDTPVFVEEIVEFVGDPILMVVGPNPKEVDKILNEIVVVYEDLEPILNLEKSDVAFFEYGYDKGSVETAMKEADEIFVETFQTGYQEACCLETQGLIGYPKDKGMTIRGSLQCPYYILSAVANVLGVEKADIQVIQDVTGGGFGAKESYPSVLASQVAVAVAKVKKPIKVIFSRREDMEFTSKRHPSVSTYKIAIKDKKITAMDIDIVYNGGAYTTLSAVVLQRGIICSSGVYSIDNLKVRGKALKTNTVPNGAYRGFGANQTFFAIEMLMTHLAKNLGENPLSFKQKHMSKQGDSTSTSGKFHFHVPLPEMIKRIDELSDYTKKYEQYKTQTGRYRKGVGISLVYHGCGFTGSGERDIIKAVAQLRKNKDNTVDVLCAGSDIGQGLKTTLCKIVADTLEISLDKVNQENPDTDLVPDSGPTVASRSIMVVGELLRKAAVRLKADWKDGEEQLFEERFVEPDFLIPFDLSKFNGDAYPTYSWAVNVVEVSVDTLTASTKVIGAWGIYDVGVAIDHNIIQGQVQGGFLQGLGNAFMEEMNYNDKGIIRNVSFSDYILPTSVDVPNLVTEIVDNPYPEGPYGAKGAGEIPTVAPAPAYAAAIENALDNRVNKAPFTFEDTMKVLQEVSK